MSLNSYKKDVMSPDQGNVTSFFITIIFKIQLYHAGESAAETSALLSRLKNIRNTATASSAHENHMLCCENMPHITLPKELPIKNVRITKKYRLALCAYFFSLVLRYELNADIQLFKLPMHIVLA